MGDLRYRLPTRGFDSHQLHHEPFENITFSQVHGSAKIFSSNGSCDDPERSRMENRKWKDVLRGSRLKRSSTRAFEDKYNENTQRKILQNGKNRGR